MPEDLRARLRAALPAAVKDRDAALVAALRTTLAALDNAEAVRVDDEGGSLGLQATPVGVGAREAPRRELSGAEVARLVGAEITDREAAADVVQQAGRPDEAARLRREAAALAEVAGLPPG